MAVLISVRGITFLLIWMMVCGLNIISANKPRESGGEVDADIVFKANMSSVVRLSVSTQDPITELTICFWVRLDPMPWIGSLVFLNHSSHRKTDNIIIEYRNTLQFAMGADQIVTGDTSPRLDDSQWKFVCAQWENTIGLASLYINGEIVANETNIAERNELMISSPRLVMGYSTSTEISGRMTCVNIWDDLLSVQSIHQLYEEYACNNQLNDMLIGWQRISRKLEKRGSPLLVTPSQLKKDPVCTVPQNLLFGQCFPETALLGHVIATKEVISELQCQDHCLRVTQCNAFNIEQSGTGNKRCQLISDITGDRRDVFSYGRIFDREHAQKILLAPCSEN